MYLKCTSWWFDLHIYCEMTTTIKLINTSTTSQLPVCVYVRLLKLYFLSKFQVHNSAWLTIVTMPSIRSLEPVHFVTERLYPLTKFSLFPPPLSPWLTSNLLLRFLNSHQCPLFHGHWSLRLSKVTLALTPKCVQVSFPKYIV